MGISKHKGDAMKFTRTRVLAGLAAIAAVATPLIVMPAMATPPQGVTITPLAPVAQFDEIDAKVKTGDWSSEIRTKGVSDLHILEVTIAPGGTFGWHSHPGPSLVIVKSGTASLYKGDDPTCTPQVVPTGSSFVDPGGDVHVVRNEGSVDLVTVVVSLVPAGFGRRIDEPAPANCPALPNG
jgi:quercetin dioxygenase-like cupin family protein